MEERLQKALSGLGVCSRRTAEEWIRDGRVRVNGNTAAIGDRVDLKEDVIEVDGKCVSRKTADMRYLMLNKPRGFVTTLSDEQGRRTVAELVEDAGTRVYPIGRLDYNSEGLLLFTNDGEFANKVMHPASEIEKVYLAWTSDWNEKAEELLKRRIEIDGREISEPGVMLRARSGATACWEIRIHEGRNRQVRRMCEAAGLHVTRLKRIAEGPLQLGELKPGKWRELTENEFKLLSEALSADRCRPEK